LTLLEVMPPASRGTSNLASRSYFAMTKVSVEGRRLDLGYKIITALNLGFKFAYSRVQDKPVTNIRWPLADCLARVRIFDVEYRFHLRKDSDHNIYMNPFYHEFDVSNFVHSVLKPGDVFVDVGAYAGSYTLAAAEIVGPKGKVVSIEPNPETLAYLKDNVSLNNLENVTVVHTAAGQASGKVTLYYDPSTSVLSSLDRKSSQRRPMWFNLGRRASRSRRVETQLTTLDELYLEHVYPREIDVVKIDTEGKDLQVLLGGQRALSHARYVVVEQNTDAERKFLSGLGFGISDLTPSGYLLATKTHQTPLPQQ
jgi:FkbM family methyltransferase